MSSRPFEGLVTPEAVVLQFETAGVGSRTAAALLDWTIRILFVVAFAIAGGVLDVWDGLLPGWAAVTLMILLIFVVVVGYPVLFETLWRGRTPGKAALGIRVVTVEGAPVRFRHAAIRGALAIIEVTMTNGALAILMVFLSDKNQRLGDMVAGTVVLRERAATRAPVATVFDAPAGAEEYVSSLDVSMLTSDEYVTVRAYLTRASDLKEPARSNLAGQLARQLASRTHASPPPSMDAETFLRCVAAAYQRRFAVPKGS